MFDNRGNQYIDFESGIWCTSLGHSNEQVNRALILQMEKVSHLSIRLTSYVAEETAVHLLRHFHWNNGKAVFLSSGSEAVELGVTIAKKAAGRDMVLTFSESYLSAYGQSGHFEDDNSWLKLDFIPCQNCLQAKCRETCPRLASIDFKNIAAFVFEPGSTHGRVIFPEQKLVTLLAERTKACGGLVVVDEVTTGLGRTGKWFGYNHYQLLPDIVVLGKSLGNGYPVSAVVMDAVVAHILEEDDFRYTQSHQNDPLGCAVAGEVIKILEETDIIEHSGIMGDIFLKELENTIKKIPLVKEIRGRGLMAGVELYKEGIVEEITARMLDKGYFIGITPTANVLRFYPPLIIEEKMIMQMCSELKQVLSEY
ncbi:MAG: aspartate aminotransferase family protein [Spirochaetales bacterium]|nr:aspartate aminotransferase family protein [Spirochaetales bacterium]